MPKVMAAPKVWLVLVAIACVSIGVASGNSRRSVGVGARVTEIGNGLPDCQKLDGFVKIREKIQSLGGDVARIVNYTLDQTKHEAWNELALFCDTFGPRLSGSNSLERAIDYMSDKMERASKLQVMKEGAMIPTWEMLEQSCEIVAPVAHQMSIMTLGYSVSTNGPLKAEAVLVEDFQRLEDLGKAGKLEGKIVVFNYKFTSYPESVIYRTEGARRAAPYKAVAALVRSVTPFSINSPHAGAGSKSIPTAAITVEDANLIRRWILRNQTVVIKLNLKTRQGQDGQSYNLIGDIKGSSRPQEVVLVSGHIDSWYNTAGAMDDGGGMIISYKALDVLSKLQLRAPRTMRAILWTAEEPGLIGVRQYFEDHKQELENFKTVIESDEGTFTPFGFGHKNFGPLGRCALNEILHLIGPRVSDLKLSSRFEGSDIEYFTDAGVPGLSLFNDNSRYFDFHHTSGDTIDLEDPDALDRGTALFAATTYALAHLVDVDMRK